MSKKFTIIVEDYNVPPQPWLLFDEVFNKGLKKETKGKLFIDDVFIFRQGQVLWAPDIEQFAAAGDYFTQRLQEEPELAKKIIDHHYAGFKEIKKFVLFLRNQNWSKLSFQEMADIYNRFCSVWVNVLIWGAIPQYLDMGEIKYSSKIEDSLRPTLALMGEPGLVFSRLLTASKSTYLSKETEAVWKLLAAWQTDKKLLATFKVAKSLHDLSASQRRSLSSLSRRFGWLQYYYDGQVAGPEYYFDLLKSREKKKAAQVLKDNKKEKIELVRWQKEVEKNLSLADRKNVRLLREFALIKELRKEIQMYYLNYSMSFWFSELGRRLHCTRTQAKYLTPQEIKDFLSKGKLPQVDSLSDRYRLSAYVSVNGKENVFIDDEASAWLKKMKLPTAPPTKSKVIKGQTAYPGKVKGVVKIVNAITDLSKFKAGDILVSFSTNPSLIPAMNKAAAIITNTGGVTCHAAIVSREMKIPCVIGTKIATRFLKDGDVVEVNADKGLIKIIK